MLDNIVKKTEVFGELMPFDVPEQKRINELILDLVQQYRFPIIATNDAHYILEEDSIVQETMLAIQSKATWDDPKRWKFNVEGLYMRTAQEMVEAFKVQGVLTRREAQTAIKNTSMVKDLCKDFHIEEVPVELPRVPLVVESGKSDKEFLQELVELGFNTIPNDEKDIYADRIEEELKLIYEKNFERYFLIVWEIVKWCNENDIMVGPGRGSAGGSLICYLLGITQVDPLKYNLLFSRFLAPSRIDYPDIDIDYEKKELVREHLEGIYGKWSVAGVSTFMYMKGKSAIRDVCRVFEIDLRFTNAVAGAIEDDKVDSLETSDIGLEFIRKYPEQYKIAKKLDGQIRGRGQHACAVVITEKDLRNGERVALVSNKKDGDLITNFDGGDIEFCGFLKLDVLGLSELVTLKEAKKLIKKNHGIGIDYNSIDLNDSKLYEQFSLGNTIGCFQVGTYGLSEFCGKLGIDNFLMLSHATSLYRPGPLRSGMSEQFIQRKNGIENWTFVHDSLRNILGFTYGVIVYQEQVMQIVNQVAGLDWTIADKVRKVIAKSKGTAEMNYFKDMFIQGCLDNKTLDLEQATALFDDIVSFGGYGFNLAHAVEYSHITAWDMYLKVYYPLEFYCASFTNTSNKDLLQRLIDDAWDNGIEIRP
ncbi:MAG TPA: DNA polymerase III subunit alpha, partial [Tissierellaceae bacterium]|nr:DNA polymerase III subunit alpha [Tissierellaceae bacterium]